MAEKVIPGRFLNRRNGAPGARDERERNSSQHSHQHKTGRFLAHQSLAKKSIPLPKLKKKRGWIESKKKEVNEIKASREKV